MMANKHEPHKFEMVRYAIKTGKKSFKRFTGILLAQDLENSPIILRLYKTNKDTLILEEIYPPYPYPEVDEYANAKEMVIALRIEKNHLRFQLLLEKAGFKQADIFGEVNDFLGFDLEEYLIR
jgi:hypothetical protein